MVKTITILGATGSIGTSTLDLVEREPDRFEVLALTANRDVAGLAAAAIRTRAKLAVVADEACLPDLRAALAHDRDEILQRIVVGLERGRLLAREGGWLSNGRTRRNRRKQQSERERRGARSGRYPDRHPDCHDGFPRPVRHRIRHPGS